MQIEKSFTEKVAKLQQNFTNRLGTLEDNVIDIKMTLEEQPVTSRSPSINDCSQSIEFGDFETEFTTERGEVQSQINKINEALNDNQVHHSQQKADIQNISEQLNNINKDIQKYGNTETQPTPIVDRCTSDMYTSDVPTTVTDYDTELITLMDSNSKFIDFRKL